MRDSGQLEILNPNTYAALSSVYSDLSKLFVDSFFHVGFDELNTGATSSPKGR